MVETQEPDREVLAVLSDDIAETILTVTDQHAMSAQSLEARCDASLTTIYRRIDELLAYGLLRERLELQPDGNHYKVFESNLEELSVNIDDGDLDVNVDRCDDAPDRFSTIWDAMTPRWG